VGFLCFLDAGRAEKVAGKRKNGRPHFEKRRPLSATAEEKTVAALCNLSLRYFVLWMKGFSTGLRSMLYETTPQDAD